MITEKSNNVDMPGEPSVDETSKAVAEIVRANKQMFAQCANLVDSVPKVNGNIYQSEVNKSRKDRIIDLSQYVPTMRTTKLNLMENGKLVLSMTKDGELFHHALTPKERDYVSTLLNNNSINDNQKLNKLTSLVNGIAINTMLQNNFDKAMSQNESFTMHR